jgi:hypothetical protein
MIDEQRLRIYFYPYVKRVHRSNVPRKQHQEANWANLPADLSFNIQYSILALLSIASFPSL